MRQISLLPVIRWWTGPRPWWCLAAVLVLVATTGSRADAAEISIQDDRGVAVELAHPARRVVALYGAYNEIIYAMGLGDRLVARTHADRYPASIVDLPSIGTHMRPNVEMVAALAPDLVLQMGGRKAASEPLAALERLGIPTASFVVSDFESMFGVIARLGTLLGAERNSRELVQGLQARLDATRSMVRTQQPRPTVFFEVRYPNLLAAGRGSLVDDVIRHAGGRNCVQSERKLARLSEEELLRLNPEYYLVQKGPMNKTPIPVTDRAHFTVLKAVQSGNWTVVDEQRYSRPGPRAVEAVEELARILHPQAFKKDTE